MQIYIPNLDQDSIGGGWTFLRNFLKSMGQDIQLAHSVADCDILFICGPTVVSREIVEQAKALKKKIVFRVDNIPEDYRNRGTAISRLKDFSAAADAVVYQSKWAREYVMSLTGVDGTVIYNGVDKSIFNKDGRDPNAQDVLYIRSSTNENKRWQEAKYIFRMKYFIHQKTEVPDGCYHCAGPEGLKLVVVGNFNDYIKLYSDDFITRYRLGLFPDEPYFYHGQVKDPVKMAAIFRSCRVVLTPYYNDACSNVVLEARASGCKIDPCDSGMFGGTKELIELPDEMIGIDRMAKEYLGLFKLVMY